MSGPRFTCVTCGKKGPIFMRPIELFEMRTDIPARSGSIHNMDPQGHFCTLRCAARYGVRAATIAAKATGGAR